MAEVAEVAEVAAERCSGGRVSTPSPSSSAPTGSGARAHLVAAVSSRTPRAGSYPPLLPLSASSNRQQKEWRRRLELASARGSKHKIVSAWRGLSVGRRSPFRRCDAVTAMFCRAQIFFFFFSYPLRRPRGPCSAHLASFPSFWRSLPNSRSKGRRSPLKARRSISPREKSGEKSSVAVRREEAAPLIARCRSQ